MEKWVGWAKAAKVESMSKSIVIAAILVLRDKPRFANVPVMLVAFK